MSKYNLDLDYEISNLDISREELQGIILEADRIITENTESREKVAEAYLKKGQCLQKLEENSNQEVRAEQQEIIKGIIEKALELSPDMPEALMQMGKIYAQLRKYPEAINFYTRAIQVKPDYPAAFNNRAGIYDLISVPPHIHWKDFPETVNNNRNKAIADYSEAIRLRQAAIFYFNRGDTYSQLKDYKKAIADYSAVIRIGSNEFKKFTDIFSRRGWAYKNLKDYDKAIADFSEKVHLYPKSIDALSLRAETYFEAGEYDKAIDDYTEIICIKKVSKEPYYLKHYLNERGKAYWLKGETDKAVSDFTETIQHSKNQDGFCFGYRGDVYRLTGDYDKAITDYSKAIQLLPEYACAYGCRGEAYRLKGECDKAIADFTEAIRLRPDYPDAWGCRGELYRIIGEQEKAEADMAELRRLKPDYSGISWTIGFLQSSVLLVSRKGQSEKPTQIIFNTI